MTNPATCRPAITPYIVISLARSWGVIAANDCHSSCLVRGDLDALAAAPRAGMLSGRAFMSVAGLYQRRKRSASHGGQARCTSAAIWDQATWPAAASATGQGMPRRASRATRHSCTGSCFSMISWRPGGRVSSIVLLRPLDLTADKRHGQFHGRGESSLLFLEQPAHVFHVLRCLSGGIHCRRPFPIMSVADIAPGR